MKAKLLSACAVVLMLSGAATAAGETIYTTAVADPSRPSADRKLDERRKPAEILAYAAVTPGEMVGEFLPGGGYYTRMLSDIVGPQGKVYAPQGSLYMRRDNAGPSTALYVKTTVVTVNTGWYAISTVQAATYNATAATPPCTWTGSPSALATTPTAALPRSAASSKATSSKCSSTAVF